MSRAAFSAAWSDVVPRVSGCTDAKLLNATRDAVIARYDGPKRHYHCLPHIAAMLADVATHADSRHDRDILVLAVLYHDAIYDATRSDNEAMSAGLAREQLAALGCLSKTVARVVELILATRHADVAHSDDDHDKALLLDVDLAILGASVDAYAVYAQAIRQEYAHVADADYRAGRARVLNAFLGRSWIYATPDLRARWESSARANLAGEIATLAAGSCAGGPQSA
jgi:predicted metal-dependent HD superfamily phosphohydrolase